MSNQVASPIETGAGHRKATPIPPSRSWRGTFSRPGTGTRSREASPAVLCFMWEVLSKGKDCSWTLELPHPKHSVLPKHIRQETSNPNKPGRMLTDISSSAQRRMHTSAPERTGCLTIDQGILISSELAGSRRAGKSFFFVPPPTYF